MNSHVIRSLSCIFILLLLLNASQSSESAKPNILLITLDTTRADHIGCYGYQKASTPNIDAICKAGLQFTNAFSSVPLTLPSHSTMLTGLYPTKTGIHENGRDGLPASVTTLAEILKANGYHTSAFVSSVVLDKGFHLDQGFDEYDDPLHAGMRLADQVTAAVVSKLDSMAQPYFVWVHYYDAHHPYNPPPPFSEQFKDNPYDGEIAFVDSQIGKLLDGFRDHHLLDNTVIVISGDHGESLGDHGEAEHGIFLYSATLRVPLIVHFPQKIQPHPENHLARLVDVTPTILDIAGIKTGQTFDGASLLGEVQDRENYEESSTGFNRYGWSPLYAIRNDQWHYILAPKPELYDLRSDPTESKNLQLANSAIASALDHQLQSATRVTTESDHPQMSPEVREQLQSLGYITGNPITSNKRSAGIDPKDGIIQLQTIQRAGDQMSKGQYKEAINALNGLLAMSPDNIQAHSTLGRCYLLLQEFKSAKSEFEAVLAFTNQEQYQLQLAIALSGLHKTDKAEKALEEALKLNPHFASAYSMLVQLHLSKGDIAGAEAIVARALKADPEDPRIFLTAGQLAIRQSQYTEAEKYFHLAISGDPSFVQAYRELGSCLLHERKLHESAEAYEKAVKLNPQYIPTLIDLGLVYLQLHDRDRALALFQTALRLEPPEGQKQNLERIIEQARSAT